MQAPELTPGASPVQVNALIEHARRLAQRAQDPTLTRDDWEAISGELSSVDAQLREVATAGPFRARAAETPNTASPPLLRRRVAPTIPAENESEIRFPDVAGRIEEDAARDVAPPGREQALPRRSGWGWGRMLLVAVLLLLVGFAVGFAWMVGSAALRAQQTAVSSGQRLADLRGAGSEPGAETVDSMRVLNEACHDAGELERDLKPITDLASAAAPATGILGQLPGVGPKATAMLTLAQAAQETSGAVRVTCDAIGPLVAATGGTGDAQTMVASFLTGLQGRRQELLGASERLRVAQRQLGEIDEQVLDDGPRRAVLALREKLPAAAGRLTLLANLPGMLGTEGPRSYLVLGQNSDELRPTGGFIGTSGVITFDRGRLVGSEYGSSFASALPADRRVPPPAPLTTFMAARYWQFWESNWWPDFPSSASQAEYFHRHSGRPEVSGVIAVNQEMIRALLKVTGPVNVREFGETVDASNVQQRLEFHVHEANYPDPIRKKFVSALFGGVMERVHSLPRERIADLTAAINEGFYEQNLQMWSTDPSVQTTLATLGWDGALLPARGDYLNIVSANLSANKINREIRQTATYRVAPEQDDRLRASLRVRFRNERPSDDPGPFKTADYRNYVRIYVPRGTELISQDGFDVAAERTDECGYTVFGGFSVVKPGMERVVSLAYRLPESVRASSYSLLVQRQSGVRAYPIELDASGLGLGEASLTLDGSQEVRPQDGRLVGRRVQADERPREAASVCETHNAPPRLLAAPASLAIPSIGVRAPVIELGVDPDGTLQAPDNGRDVAWYPQGARPGQGGNMVVAAHLDWNRAPGTFFKLAEVKPGDRVAVTADDGAVHTYTVEWVRRYDARDAPLNQILGPTTDSWLTMITCGGPFDRTVMEYRDRVVVRASLVS